MDNIPVAYKDIDVNGRKFRLNKMDARTGSYMLFKLIKILTPMFNNIKGESLKDMNIDDLNLTELASSLFDLKKEEFEYIQDNCLQVIEELLPAGAQKILNQYGVWGIENLQLDTSLVMNLTLQSLVFNLSGFFSESPLSSMLKGFNLSQLNMKI